MLPALLLLQAGSPIGDRALGRHRKPSALPAPLLAAAEPSLSLPPLSPEQVPEKAKHYGISTVLKEPVDPAKDLVLQVGAAGGPWWVLGAVDRLV